MIKKQHPEKFQEDKSSAINFCNKETGEYKQHSNSINLDGNERISQLINSILKKVQGDPEYRYEFRHEIKSKLSILEQKKEFTKDDYAEIIRLKEYSSMSDPPKWQVWEFLSHKMIRVELDELVSMAERNLIYMPNKPCKTSKRKINENQIQIPKDKNSPQFKKSFELHSLAEDMHRKKAIESLKDLEEKIQDLSTLTQPVHLECTQKQILDIDGLQKQKKMKENKPGPSVSYYENTSQIRMIGTLPPKNPLLRKSSISEFGNTTSQALQRNTL